MKILSAVKKIRDMILPIQKHERKRFFCMLSLFFLIALAYNILRSLKVALVVAAPHSGAEIIPYIKVWGILPAAFLFTYLFTKLSQRMIREYIFFTMLAIFTSFFLIFLFYLYPNSEKMELSSTATFLQSVLPSGLYGLIAMIRYWHLTLFYLFAELWGSIILSMLYWGFINEITNLSDAKRFYGIFAMSANISAVFAGKLGLKFSQNDFNPGLPFGNSAWEQSLTMMMTAVFVCIGLIFILFYALNREVEIMHQSTSVEPHAPTVAEKKAKEKVHFTLVESFVRVLSSRHLLFLALIVCGYNLVYNLTDVIWTHELKLRFSGNTRELTAYMSQVTMAKGMLATLVGLFVTSRVLHRFGWFVTAIITPVIILGTSLFFFPLLLFKESFFAHVLMELFSEPIIVLCVFIGAIQNCMTRASKYTLFDATKEMAYIPLRKDEQRKGKAAIDGVGSRLGKSGGSIIFQVLLLFCSSLDACIPYVAIIVILVICVWLFAIWGLHKEMEKKLEVITAE